MATAQQLKALIESCTERNPERFLSVAAQIAAHAARTGKDKLAEELRKLIEDARRKQADCTDRTQTIPIAQPTGELSGLVAAAFPKTRLADMVLDAALGDRLKRVITEYRQVERLDLRSEQVKAIVVAWKAIYCPTCGQYSIIRRDDPAEVFRCSRCWSTVVVQGGEMLAWSDPGDARW